MISKAKVIKAWNEGMKKVKYPLLNIQSDGKGGYCAVGILSSQKAYEILSFGGARAPDWLYSIPEVAPNGGMNRIKQAGGINREKHFGSVLASIFNVTGSFEEAYTWMEKQLDLYVEEGLIESGEEDVNNN